MATRLFTCSIIGGIIVSYRFTRFATNSVAIALLILSALSIPVSASLQSADQTALGNLAERFFAAYQKQDLDALMLLWSEKSADYAASKQSLQQSFTANKIELKSTTIGKLTLDGEKASLRVVMDSSAVEVKTGKPADGFGKKNRTLHFIKESGVWKVSRFVSSEEELAAAIATAKTAEERKALLEADRELVTIELPRALNEQSTRLRNRGSSSQALAVSQMALTIAQELGDKPAIATALRNTGIVYQLQGNTPLAMENYQKSLNIYEAIGDKSGISNTLNSIGLAHFSQGNHTHAMENYQKSLSISEAIGFKAGIANTLNNLGNIHISQGDSAHALDYYHRSLKIAEEIGNKTSIANTLNNLGIVYQSQGNYTQAMEYHQKNLKNRMEIGDKSGLSSTLNNIGNILLLQGNYAQALEYFQKSLTLREELGYKDRIAITLNDIGTAHQWQGNYAQALEYYQKSLNLSEETGNKTTISGNLNNIGLAHQSQGNYTQAMEYYQKSLKISEAIGYKAGIANVLNNIGIIHRFQGNNAQALDYYHRSLKLKEESGLKAGIANTLNNIGNVFLLEGNYTQALAYYERSLKIKEEIGYKDGIAIVLNDIGSLHQMQGNYTQALELANKAAAIAKEIGYLEMSWQARTTAGQAYRALNQFDLARQSFTDAIATIEDLRYQIAGAEQHQQQFFESKLFPYYEMIDLLIAQNNPQEALSFAERSKSRVLLDVLRGGKVNITKAMSSQEQEEERNLNSELVSLNSQLYKEKQREQSDQIRLADLAARLEKTRLQVEAFQTNLYAAHPELRVQRGEFHRLL
jgi:tetratricopeptide (TPR) repeat protein